MHISSPEARRHKLGSMIISVSGWRFCYGKTPESRDPGIDTADQDIAALVALAFLRCVPDGPPGVPRTIAVGTDTRPTGAVLGHTVVAALTALGVSVRWLGRVPSPQIMAWCRVEKELAGFLYVTASHNPIGYNGFKMGLDDGGVFSREVAEKSAQIFREVADDQEALVRLRSSMADLEGTRMAHLLQEEQRWHRESLESYQHTALQIARGGEEPSTSRETDAFVAELRRELQDRPLGIAGDLNGSARCTAPDRTLLPLLGVRTVFIHDRPGEIAHQILPEDAGLDDAAALLQELHRRDPAFRVAYVPDNDGDRGNLVFMDDAGTPVLLSAQEVFAMVVLTELSWSRRSGSPGQPLAVVANDATSLRVEQIAAQAGARVFRAEVGEANAVARGRQLTADGWLVPVVGEGSNGGIILPPAAVRDPLNTLLSLLKLHCFSLAATDTVPRPSFAEVRAMLPVYTTTSTDNPLAKLEIPGVSHKTLKGRYEELLEKRFGEVSDLLEREFSVTGYAVENYEGTSLLPGAGNRTGDHSGGMRVVLQDSTGAPRGALWMRGSRTEPVFRVMADLPGECPALHDQLITWHRELITKSSRE